MVHWHPACLPLGHKAQGKGEGAMGIKPEPYRG